MGGYGSTRWNHERTRTSTGGLLRLDVRQCSRQGALAPGAVATLTWTNGEGEPAGSIQTACSRDGSELVLSYATQRAGADQSTRHRIPVRLDTTPCHFGGERWWFRCPGCHARRAVLYSAGGVFACVRCHDLAYASTREDAMDRANRRLRWIAGKLGGDGNGRRGFLWTMPDKPKGMHWRTYDRLTRELLAANDLRDEVFAEAAVRILARADRFLRSRGVDPDAA